MYDICSEVAFSFLTAIEFAFVYHIGSEFAFVIIYNVKLLLCII